MATVFHHDPQQEYYFEEGCYITELLNGPLDPAVSIARARLAPGTQTRWHQLRATVERYTILAGHGRVELGDETKGQQTVAQVGPLDVVLIPPDCPQRIINTGTEDLVFLAICSPRFSASNYLDLETSS